MAVTVGKLFGNGAILYNMKLLGGQKGLNNLVEWVHIIEDADVSKFLHGNEVVLTAGILNDNKGWMLQFTKKLYSVGTSAFVVNIGPYTQSIPKEVIEYCNTVNLPIYTIPWETRMVDITRDICYQIMQKEQVEISLATTIKNIIFKIGDMETQVLQMERYGYQRTSNFCFITMSFEFEGNESKEIRLERIKKYAEKIARNIHELYISFSYKEYLVLALVDYSNYNINNFINTFLKNREANKYKWKVHMGVSENKEGISLQDDNFNKALIATQMAIKKNEEVIFYDKLDIYKVLLNTKDKDELRKYYDDSLGKLEKYDKENNTDLLDFLLIYFKNDGSQSRVAEKQFIHRNTVNNQIKKIEKITGYNLLNLEDKMRLYLGFYIRDLI